MSEPDPEKIVAIVGEATKVLQENFSLWRAASKNLDDPIDIVDPQKPSIRVVLSSLKATVESKYAWLGKDGKDSKLYEYFGKFISGLTAIESLVDKGVALDVSGKAALPWAVIKLGLGLVKNEYQEYVAIVDGMEIVTEVVDIYANIEVLFVDDRSARDYEETLLQKPEKSASECLNSAIVAVYTSVLNFLLEARDFFGSEEEAKKGSLEGKHKWRKAWNTFVSKAKRVKGALEHAFLSTPEAYLALVDDIAVRRSKVKYWSDFVQRESQLDLVGRARRIEQSLKERSDATMLSWISPVVSVTEHAKRSQPRLSGSGVWLMTDLNYDKWRSQPGSSFLWLDGSGAPAISNYLKFQF